MNAECVDQPDEMESLETRVKDELEITNDGKTESAKDESVGKSVGESVGESVGDSAKGESVSEFAKGDTGSDLESNHAHEEEPIPKETELKDGSIVTGSHDANFDGSDFGDFDEFDELVDTSPIQIGITPLPPIKTKSDYLSPTSKLLWQQLVDNPNAQPIDWNHSAVRRKLAVSLGIPLNLDETKPKVHTRRIVISTKRKPDDKLDCSRIEEWRQLSTVSAAALENMTAQEVSEYTNRLNDAVLKAKDLHDALEAHQEDLLADKQVLEGMVESMLVYSQQRQRERLKRRN